MRQIYTVLRIDPEIRIVGDQKVQLATATDGTKFQGELSEYWFTYEAGAVDPGDRISGICGVANPTKITEIVVESGRSSAVPAPPVPIEPVSVDPTPEYTPTGRFVPLSPQDTARVAADLEARLAALEKAFKLHLGVCPTSREKSSPFGNGFSSR